MKPECWVSIKDYQIPALSQLNQKKISRSMTFIQKDRKLISSVIEDLLKKFPVEKVSAKERVFEEYILSKRIV